MKIGTLYAQFGKSQTHSKQELLSSTCKNNDMTINVIKNGFCCLFLSSLSFFLGGWGRAVIGTGW